MALINTTVPNLVGGVTQQSDSLRFDNQCTEQINANPSVTRGLEKRAPSEHVAELKDSSGNRIDAVSSPYKVHTHTINRDTNERYVVTVVQKQNNHGYTDDLYRPEVLVHDIDGNPQTVYWDPSYYGAIEDNNRKRLLSYLAPIDYSTYWPLPPEEAIPAGDEREPDIKFSTVGDVTLMLNTKKYPEEHPIYDWKGGPPFGAEEKLGKHSTIQIRKAVHNATYKITFKQSGSYGYSLIYTTPSNLSTGQTSSVVGSETTTTVSYDPEADDLSCGFIAEKLASISQQIILWSTTGITVTALGDTIIVLPSTDGVYEPRDYTLVVEGPTEDSMVFSQSSVDSFSKLSNKDAVTTLGAPVQFLGYDVNSQPVTGDWAPDMSFQYGWPWFGGRKVEVTSSPSSEEDDYWVEFLGTKRILYYSDSPPYGAAPDKPVTLYEGRWAECPKPFTNYGIYHEYGMPLILIRQADGTWLVKTANGKTPESADAAYGQPAYTAPEDPNAYSAYMWKYRRAGDEDTNPRPTFINKSGERVNTINAMTFHNNRLVFATDENVCMSESGDIWNFYRTTVTTLLDSDPIDVASTSAQVSVLRNLLPFEDRLLLLADQTQFLAYGEPVLAPSTIAISPITSFETSKEAIPITQGGSVFFPFKRGDSSGLREWYSNRESNLTFSSNDITAHIPTYIKGNITKMASASQENVILCLADQNKDTLYCFNYFETGQGREQFAWSKYQFPGSIIHNVEFIGETAYITHSNKTIGGNVSYRLFLSKINFQPNRTEDGQEYLIRLDRKLTNDDVVAAAYSASTDITYVVLPHEFTLKDDVAIGDTDQTNPEPRNQYRIVSKNNVEIGVPVAFTAGDQIGFKGDWSSTSPDVDKRTWCLGESFDMSYTFSKPLFKPSSNTGGKSPAIEGRHQLRYGSLIYSNSGPFDISVTQADGTKYSHSFSGKILGSPDTTLGTMTLGTGEFKFPIFSESESVTIQASSSSPIGPRLESAEFEANFSTRSRKM